MTFAPRIVAFHKLDESDGYFFDSLPQLALLTHPRRAFDRNQTSRLLRPREGRRPRLLDLPRARRLTETSAARLREGLASEISGSAISEQLSALQSQKLPEDGNVPVALFKNEFA